MKQGLALAPAEREEVERVLRDHLPPGTSVRVFGSRVNGRTKPWSDLDLVIQADEPLSLEVLATLAEAFDESTLPFKVDLVDRRSVSDAFGALIDADAVPLL